MADMRHARRFLWILAFTAALGTFPVFAATTVVSEVHLVQGTFDPGSQPDGNSVILDAPEGLIVIDTGRHPAHTRQVLEYAQHAKRPIAAVVNTHWHLDHTGGNLMVRQQFPSATVYATDALNEALTGFLANYRSQLEQMLIDPSTAAAAKKGFETELNLIRAGTRLGPDVIVSRAGRRVIAGRPLYLGFETNTVTAGDLWILDEKTGVLIAGDLVTLPAPFLDTACPARWKEALDQLETTRFDLLVPGHGSPMTHAQFATYRAAFGDLLACAARKDSKDQCIDMWVHSLEPMLADSDASFTRSVMAYYVDLLRGDETRFRKLCGNS
jgi:glyoxylase-like metal-dependent hydrolase (beta-lactamase superfamily II)